jgi:protease I
MNYIRWVLFLFIYSLAVGCAPVTGPTLPTPTDTPLPPTLTPRPSATFTAEPTATPTPAPTATAWKPGLPHALCTPSQERACKVVFILPARYYAEQGRSFPDQFRQAGYQVTIASNALQVVEVCENTVGVDQATKDIPVDISLEDVLVSQYDAVIFIGGLGCQDQWEDAQSHLIAQQTLAQGKVLGAAGCAPTILAYAGVMHDKQAAICSLQVPVKHGQDYCQVLRDLGAICVDAPIVRDGLIITAKQKSEYFVAGVIEVILEMSGP